MTRPRAHLFALLLAAVSSTISIHPARGGEKNRFDNGDMIPIEARVKNSNLDWNIVGVSSQPLKPPPASAPISVGYLSYRDLHSSAKRRGGYRPLQRVVIAVCVDTATMADWARTCSLNGWTFCIHNRSQPGLECGVHSCYADAQGVLRRWDPAQESAAFRAIQYPTEQSQDSARIDLSAPAAAGNSTPWTVPWPATVVENIDWGNAPTGGISCSGGACIAGS